MAADLPDAPWAEKLPDAPWAKSATPEMPALTGGEGGPGLPEQPASPHPAGYLDRVAAGWMSDTADIFKEGVEATASAPGQLLGLSPPTGYEDLGKDMEKKLISIGASDEEAKRESDFMLRRLQRNQGLLGLIGGPLQAITSPLFGAYRAAVSRPIEEATGFPKETTEGLTMAAVAAAGIAPHTVGRVRISPAGEVSAQAIGEMPKEADFKTSAEILGGEHTEANLRRAWDENGIHPAEAVNDAARDAFVKHDLTAEAKPVELPPAEAEVLAETGGMPARGLGADVTGEPPTSVPLSTTPAAPPGRLMTAAHDAADKLYDMGRDMQMLVAPMARGTTDSMAIAKDFANSLRRNRWDWSRIDGDIEKRFTQEQRERMWNAADEESVLRQEAAQKAPPPPASGDVRFYHGGESPTSGGPRWVTPHEDYARNFRRNGGEPNEVHYVDIPKSDFTKRTDLAGGFDDINNYYQHFEAPEDIAKQLKPVRDVSEHMGLATLEPEERAAVEEMHARSQVAWLRMRDLGMVEGEGLPAYTPRMMINAASATSRDAALPLNGIGGNLTVRTAQMMRRKYLLAEETEAAAKARLGTDAVLARDIRALPLATSRLEDAIAGRTLINSIEDYGKRTGAETMTEGAIPADAAQKWFTLDHPAFRKWRPRFEEVDGKMQAALDAKGDAIFEQVPIYVRGDFEGPLRAVLTEKSGALYQAAMSLKGKTMSLIMNSPLIHNAVEWGRAMPSMPGKVATFKIYFEGNRARKDVPTMHEAIDAGMVPIGHRFFNQDITSIMEAPDLAPGRSLTAKILGFVPGLFDEGANLAVRSAIDKAGNFWHNTLLWDRVADLQAGLYTNFRDEMLAKGVDRQTAARAAAHWANRYAGALPQEAMSNSARKISNMLLFSRSFTMGNLGALKDVFTGLPKDVLAQIERDAGFREGAIAGAEAPAPGVPEAVAYAKSMARRKAMAIVTLDIGMMYIGNSLLQNVANVLLNDSTLDKELHGYAERFLAKMQSIKEHPLELIQPLNFLQSLSATATNEPGKQDRIHIGNAADGTAIYARNPVGKIADEFIGYMTGPLDMLRRKLGTVARPAWQVMSNDAGFGRKVYDPDADTPAKYLGVLGAIAKHFAAAQVPTGQIGALSDLVKGEGDWRVNLGQGAGPFAGVTFSKGAPGGQAVGEMYNAKTQHEFAVQAELPDIRRQIQRGDVAGAQERMTELGIPGGLQRFYVKTTTNPSTRLGGRTLKDFYLYSTPEQKQRLENAR